MKTREQWLAELPSWEKIAEKAHEVNLDVYADPLREWLEAAHQLQNADDAIDKFRIGQTVSSVLDRVVDRFGDRLTQKILSALTHEELSAVAREIKAMTWMPSRVRARLVRVGQRRREELGEVK